MALSDWQSAGEAERSGGQGTVKKVRRASSGEFGALKSLHPESLKSTERRYRFLQEVSALRALKGEGAPRVLDANESCWESPGASLYLIMEWVDGLTLAEKVKSGLATIDEAVNATVRLCEVFERCHAFPLHHRDIKPDNVINLLFGASG